MSSLSTLYPCFHAQAWFLIDIGALYFSFSRQWSMTHNIDEEVEVEHRGCCKRMLYSCCNCLKWIFCGIFLLCRRCLVWTFCPHSSTDRQLEFGISYHEYKAWAAQEDIGQREIPYQRLGTQNYFYAAVQEDDRFEDDEERNKRRFSSVDFLVKDLKVGMENQMELAYIPEKDNEDKANGNIDGVENDNGVAGKNADQTDDADINGDTSGQVTTNDTVILKVDDDGAGNNEDTELIAGKDEQIGNTAVAATDSDEAEL